MCNRRAKNGAQVGEKALSSINGVRYRTIWQISFSYHIIALTEGSSRFKSSLPSHLEHPNTTRKTSNSRANSVSRKPLGKPLTVRTNTSIDWTINESVRAKLRTVVRRILRKYGYPPDKQEKATLTVLEQAELLSAEWA